MAQVNNHTTVNELTWIGDTGASKHIVGNAEDIGARHSVRPHPLDTVGGTRMVEEEHQAKKFTSSGIQQLAAAAQAPSPGQMAEQEEAKKQEAEEAATPRSPAPRGPGLRCRGRRGFWRRTSTTRARAAYSAPAEPVPCSVL